MLVHRIENKVDGLGPFRSRAVYGPWGDAVSPPIEKLWDMAREKLPAPVYEAEQYGLRPLLDQIIPTPDLAHFGNASHEDLMRWVPARSRRELDRLGFVERIYEVPDDAMVPLPSQIIYRHDAATLVDEIPLVA